MNKIDLNKIRGRYNETIDHGNGVFGTAGGDDTIESIKMVAEKVNELIDFLNTNTKI